MHCRIIALRYTYITSRCDLDLWSCGLDLWPLTLNICSVSPVTWNSVPNLNAIQQSAAELLRFQCLTLLPRTCFKCCAWLWDNFHQVWPSTTYRCLNYSVFWCWYVMSCCDLKLLQHFGCHTFKFCTKFERNRVIHGWVINDLARFRVQF